MWARLWLTATAAFISPQRTEITVNDKNFGGNWDAICGYGSYGFKQGLLEVMGNIRDNNGVEGWLTAEQVVEIARKAGQQT